MWLEFLNVHLCPFATHCSFVLARVPDPQLISSLLD
jgi:hypothetical protein